MTENVTTPDAHRTEWESAHPVPDFEVPVGWRENEPMRNFNGSQVSIRSEDFRYHVDINGVPERGTIDGPYWAELRTQVGPDDSFVTRSIYRLTGIEPGAVQDAVYLLVGEAIKHDLDQ